MSQNAGRNYFAILTEGFDTTEANGIITLSPQFQFQSSELITAILIAPEVGVAGYLTVDFTGTYAYGEQAKLTITSNMTSRQQWRKTYVYTVVAGDTLTTIAAAMAALITADNGVDSPYASAIAVAGQLTITQKGDDKRGLVGYPYTDSVAGVITNTPTLTVYSEGQPSDLEDRGVPAADINLASYDTVRIAANVETPAPFINSVGANASEIYWYGTVGKGAALVTQVTT